MSIFFCVSLFFCVLNQIVKTCPLSIYVEAHFLHIPWWGGSPERSTHLLLLQLLCQTAFKIMTYVRLVLCFKFWLISEWWIICFRVITLTQKNFLILRSLYLHLQGTFIKHLMTAHVSYHTSFIALIINESFIRLTWGHTGDDLYKKPNKILIIKKYCW